MIFGIASNATAYVDNTFVVKERPASRSDIKIEDRKVNEINTVAKQVEAKAKDKIPENVTLGSKIDIFV